MGKVLKETHSYPAIDLSAHPLLLIGESERTQYLQKLHDGLGQMIAALNMQLSAIRKSQPGNEALKQSMELLKHMNKEYRDICHYLLPPPPEYPGIEDAFRILCNHVKNTASCSIQFRNHNFAGALPPPTTIGVYRILQDLMSYIINRPGCSAVEASMWHQEKQLYLSIRGDGSEELQTGQPFRVTLPENLFVKTTLLGSRLHVDVIKPSYANILLVIPCPRNEI